MVSFLRANCVGGRRGSSGGHYEDQDIRHLVGRCFTQAPPRPQHLHCLLYTAHLARCVREQREARCLAPPILKQVSLHLLVASNQQKPGPPGRRKGPFSPHPPPRSLLPALKDSVASLCSLPSHFPDPKTETQTTAGRGTQNPSC